MFSSSCSLSPQYLGASAWWLLHLPGPAAHGSQQPSWVPLQVAWRWSATGEAPPSNSVASSKAQRLAVDDMLLHPRRQVPIKSIAPQAPQQPLHHPVSHAIASSMKSGPQPREGDLYDSQSSAPKEQWLLIMFAIPVFSRVLCQSYQTIYPYPSASCYRVLY